MIYLPQLHFGVAIWRLPLSGRGAERMALALLSEMRERQIAELEELVRTEPGLVLWAVCRAECWQVQPPRDLAAVAIWLAEQGLDALQWTQEELQSGQSADEDLLCRWGDLAADSVATALSAAESAGEDATGPAYLHGLLHAGRNWLESCGPAPDAVLGQGLPIWLAAAQTPGRPPQTAEAIRDWWCNSRDEWGRRLPGLIGKLRRLVQLESEFLSALEREKLDALKELAYGASHEINNPLANISTRAQTLMREEPDPERRRKLAVINAQAFRAHEMISDMMLFARPPALQRQAVDLSLLVDRVIRELREDAAAQGTVLERVSASLPVTISGDPTHLAVALKALCTNSLEALRAGGRIEIAVGPPEAATGGDDGDGWAEIVVSDTGPGISPEVRRHLFDPYFSGREAGRGLGLGLSKCWRIVTEHGGRIEVSSRPHHETTFTIQLPIEAPAKCPAAERR